MSSRSSRNSHVIFVMICIGVTLALALAVHSFSQRRATFAFDSVVSDSRAAMMVRFDKYLLSLNGLAAFVDSSDTVMAQDWSNYVEALDIAQTLPGMLGLGLIVPTEGTELTQLLDGVRAAGEPELVVHPQTGSPDKMIIRFVAPMATNAPARGLDIAFEENRRTAALTARDTGQPQITGPITLQQGPTAGWGALFLRPIYDVTPVPADPVARQAALTGWVYAPFFSAQALAGLTQNQSDLFGATVQDGAEVIFASDDLNADPAQVRRETLSMFGRDWTVTWQSTPRFDLLYRSWMPFVITLVGFAISLLLWRYLRMQAGREDEITQQVDIKTRALSDQASQNRSVIDNSVFGVMHLDGDGLITWANLAATRIIGTDEAALVGRPLTGVMSLDRPDADETQPQPATVFANGLSRKLEIQVNRWARSDGTPVQSVLLRDITEESAARQVLGEAEERWNLALQGAQIGVFDIDLTTMTTVVSDTWRRMMSMDDGPDLITAEAFTARVHPDDMGDLRMAYGAAIAGTAARSITEYRVKVPDGSWRWVRSDAVVVTRDDSGKALRMVGSQTDIHALRTAQIAQSHSEELLNLVIERAPVGTAIIDADGVLTRRNGAMTTMTGFSEDELVGSHLGFLLLEPERETVLAAIADLQGDPARTYRGEHRIRHAEDEIRWGLVKVSWAFDLSEEVEFYIVQINDVTREKRADQVKSEFIATVSHELRTPLTSIKGALGLMAAARAKQPGQGPDRMLEIASANTNRLISLVNDILDLEKITAGKMEFHIASHSAAALVSQALENNRPLLLRNDLSFKLVDRSGGAAVLVDENRISQVLNNLLSNACKYAPPSSPVVVDISADGDIVRFDVTDRGPGVPEAFRKQIFTPFSQADSSDTRQKGGTGLGLNISKEVVEKMGGHIGFDSEPDVRTTFYFTCRRAPAPTVVRSTAEDRDVRKKVILHLEDDADFADVISYSMAGVAQITTAATLAEARERMTERRYDLILIDWVLRDGDAGALLDELIAAQPEARIVVLSSSEMAISEKRIDRAMTKSRDGISDIVENLKQEMQKTIAA